MSASVSENRGNDDVSVTKLDIHVDSPVVGKYAYILETTKNIAMASGFTNDLAKPIRVPIVIAAVAYDCEYTGETHIMVIHNVLYLKT